MIRHAAARAGPRAALVVALAVAALASAAPPGLAQSAAGPDEERLTLPERPDVAPRGYTRTAASVTVIAAGEPRVSRETREAPRPTYSRAYLKGGGQWQVSFYVPPEPPDLRGEEIAQVVIDDRSGRVLETWAGPQVDWRMARGIPGQFGRGVNAPWVWIGLCLLFVAPFARPPLRMLHLDLAVLLAFSVSYAFFGAARLGVSVPSAYPLLGYLLLRMLGVAFRGRPDRPTRLAVHPGFLVPGLVFLVGFRLALNVVDGNVIDVGYSGVIGGDRLLHGEQLYGGFPPGNDHGDTYGPVAYAAYAPFVLAFPWSGSWDDLPAAHAAAVAFDLACIAMLWLGGRRLGGRELGVLLAYLWAACPFTLLVANSGANDALVAGLVLAAFLCSTRPVARGALGGARGYDEVRAARARAAVRELGERRGRAAAAAALTGGVLVLGIALGPGLERFWDRTLGFQSERSSPFSVWGLYGGLDALQALVTVAAAALAVAVAFLPRERDEVTVAALGAAVLIALQLAVTHWFYLYLVWFLPLMLIALLAPRDLTPAADAAPGRSPSPRAAGRTGSGPR